MDETQDCSLTFVFSILGERSVTYLPSALCNCISIEIPISACSQKINIHALRKQMITELVIIFWLLVMLRLLPVEGLYSSFSPAFATLYLFWNWYLHSLWKQIFMKLVMILWLFVMHATEFLFHVTLYSPHEFF